MTDLKLQRWVDLIAVLLSRHFGTSFDQLRREVPAYASAQNRAALSRMFERDKDELRAFGIPIEMATRPRNAEPAYTIDARELYLPFLALLTAGAPRQTRLPVKEGYRRLPVFTLEPDTVAAVLEGARLAGTLDDPLIAADAAAATRKLLFDFPAGRVDHDGAAPVRSPAEHHTDPGALRVIGEAMLRRKRVRFTYHSMSHDDTGSREVEPFGLFFLSGHWYLAGRDRGVEAVRNFRVSRMADVAANTRKAQTQDFTVPPAFRLAEHARSREAWELGDGQDVEMIVSVPGEGGAAHAVRSMGEAVRGHPEQRRFQVRRLDSFARWVLSFGGEVVPVAPARLVEAYGALVTATLSLYEGARR